MGNRKSPLIAGSCNVGIHPVILDFLTQNVQWKNTLSIFWADAQIFSFGTTQTSGENLKFGRLGIFGDHPFIA
jgi:hypothetical protein